MHGGGGWERIRRAFLHHKHRGGVHVDFCINWIEAVYSAQRDSFLELDLFVCWPLLHQI